jgi:hypothetical protein
MWGATPKYAAMAALIAISNSSLNSSAFGGDFSIGLIRAGTP